MSVEKLEGVESLLHEGRYPQWAYNDDSIYQLELDQIFGKTWCYVGHKTEIPDPGDYTRRYIGEDPFIFIRDEDGEVRVFFNSCRHRGATLCQTDSGNASHFRCPYHGWTFSNSGDLVGVPQKQALYSGLEENDWALIEAPRVDSYRGLVFASLSEDVPNLSDYLGDLKWYLDIVFGLTEGGMEVVGEPWKSGGDYNWKVGVENSCSDNYHFITTHQSALQTGMGSEDLDNEATDARPHPFVNLPGAAQASIILRHNTDKDIFFGFSEEVVENLNPELSQTQVEMARKAAFFNCAIFPNMTVVLFPSKATPSGPAHANLLVRIHRPISRNESESWKWMLVPKETPEEHRQEMQESFLTSFGSSGLIEPDDLSAWERVTESAGSTLSKKRNVEMNFEAGMPDITGGLDMYEDWAGPGEVTDGQMMDLGLRKFHWMWYNSVSNSETLPHETQL